jgi:hypothetical protein
VVSGLVTPTLGWETYASQTTDTAVVLAQMENTQLLGSQLAGKPRAKDRYLPPIEQRKPMRDDIRIDSRNAPRCGAVPVRDQRRVKPFETMRRYSRGSPNWWCSRSESERRRYRSPGRPTPAARPPFYWDLGENTSPRQGVRARDLCFDWGDGSYTYRENCF